MLGIDHFGASAPARLYLLKILDSHLQTYVYHKNDVAIGFVVPSFQSDNILLTFSLRYNADFQDCFS